MALVPYLDADQLADSDRELLARPTNLARALANNPTALRAFSTSANWIRHQTELDSRLRELAILQVSFLVKNAYEFSHHIQLAQELGATKADIADLVAAGEGRPHHLGRTEELVLRFTSEVTLEGRAGQATWQHTEQALGRAQALELLLIVSFFNNVVRILDTLRIEVEPEWSPYLDEFPLG